MPFTFPTARDDRQAEELWRMTRTHVAGAIGGDVRNTPIRAVDWEHEGCVYRAVVGERFAPTGDRVMAILESATTYLVCTPSRGFLRALPVVARKREMRTVEHFSA
jgi:hypothetical protein